MLNKAFFNQNAPAPSTVIMLNIITILNNCFLFFFKTFCHVMTMLDFHKHFLLSSVFADKYLVKTMIHFLRIF